ncbi:Sua5/YciO/YrdC/YwlC family protein [Mycoplasma sp. CSL10137]|uniref:L-threonylcarbamoyladenylate synthase n=1 Tax=Mycoplasma sp. CSL10137 TaxID=2813824 RepID=UPI00197BD39E|nr:Sua5/YciO/YrdC/YwlC family protein [Mycoplasma sp. CSL10137]MBN4083438.1 Sua5/YciO/YrdC/YwlC family protein [Mycoplasma sp. CSL10137]
MNNFDDIIICSTDTVVGIGGKVNDEVLEKIYFLKNRPSNKKIIILVGSIEQALEFGQFNQTAKKIAQKEWPGATTIIVNNQGFRMPNNKKLIDFLLKNGPHYMTSANKSGFPPIKIEQAKEVFPEVKNVYDFGPGTNVPSILINLDTNEVIKR